MEVYVQRWKITGQRKRGTDFDYLAIFWMVSKFNWGTLCSRCRNTSLNRIFVKYVIINFEIPDCIENFDYNATS